MIRSNWNEQLTVDANIVRLLSAATYEDFPSAIRELVSNSFDADATEVKINVDLEKDFIVVSDNGNGMSRAEFKFFLRIAGQQRARELSPNFARKRIGQFGIGFLAIFPFGREIKISSTSRRSDTKIEAVIPSEQYFDSKGFINVENIQIPGIEIIDPGLRTKHGVEFFISPLTDLAKRYLLRDAVSGKSTSTTERLRWILQDDLPLDYAKDSPYATAFSDLQNSSDFRVTLNDSFLNRNSPGSDILENDEWRFDGIRCRYVIATNWKSLPNNERGLKIRLRNVGIGQREFFGLGTEGRTFSRLHWLTGEIRIIEGFDSLLNIDRAKFRESPEYDSFRDYFASRLRHHAYRVESVSEAKRDIERQFNDSRIAEVGPRKELVENYVSKLIDRGFKVKRNDNASSSPSVNVDIPRRTIIINETPDGPSAPMDYVLIGREKVPVVYSFWDISSDPRAVRRSSEGRIEINQAYVLFRSKRYGEVFRRILVILLLADEKAGCKSEIQAEFARQLLAEFIDLV